MTAQDIVQCVERLEFASAQAREWAKPKYTDIADWPVDRATSAALWARDAAHEAHRLLRLAEGREARTGEPE